MKKAKLYICPSCSNVLFSTGETELSCCGRRMTALVAKPQDESHTISVEEIENDYYVTLNHEMSKSHYISFVACVNYDRILLLKLYPEQNAEVRFPQMRGRLYVCCNQHGLWERK